MGLLPQQAGYTLFVNKTNGYNNGSQIRGQFSAEVSGPAEGVKTVRFLMDGKPFAEASQPPYKVGFRTTDFSEGWHVMTAEVVLADGSTQTTPGRRFEFVSAEAESAFFRNIVIPLVGSIFGLIAVIYGVQFLSAGRNKSAPLPPGAPRSYGLKGGGICPRCQRAFSLHWWSLNMLGSVYDRCDHCGRWSMVRIASRAELDAAVEAERKAAGTDLPGHERSEADRLKDLLDRSRFDS